MSEKAPTRRRRRVLKVFSLAVAALAAPYVAIDAEPDVLDDSVRRASGGQFARLSAGYTHYAIGGIGNAGPTLVLVHGTTIPSLAWDRNVAELVGAGLRVVRYDLYGRGLSDRPAHARYDLDFYVRQLDELLAHLALEGPVDLAGFSLGGNIVAEFTRRHPDRVRRLALLAPGGVADLPLIARVAAWPGVGEYVMRVMGARQLRPSRRMLRRPERHPELDDRYLASIRFRGSRQAVLDTLRRVPYTGYADNFRELGDLGKPILLVWGRHDAVVPFTASDRVRELVRPARFVIAEEAGHLASYEQPETVNAALAGFLHDR